MFPVDPVPQCGLIGGLFRESTQMTAQLIQINPCVLSSKDA